MQVFVFFNVLFIYLFILFFIFYFFFPTLNLWYIIVSLFCLFFYKAPLTWEFFFTELLQKNTLLYSRHL